MHAFNEANPMPAAWRSRLTEDSTTAAFENRFLLVTVASRRVLQIRGGSRPRVEIASHKPSVQAVAEVLAGCVLYTMSENSSSP
jgi:DNA-directed RNA polymerase omega subunit